MNWKNFKDESKKRYGTNATSCSLEQLNAGSLQRIADATEVMAQSYNRLLSDNQYLKKRFKEEQKINQNLRRQNAGLKGAITKLKKKEKARASTTDEH